MAEPYSPLRYPGGKAALTPFLAGILRANRLLDGVYVEPYAGGAGAALGLLIGEHVDRIVINDADRRVHAFWWAILNRTARFLKLLATTPVTIAEWRRQRQIYARPARHSQLRVGFATFFLNRCNRSGILVNAGPIGGYQQAGHWKLDARYDRTKLAARIERVARYRERIELFNRDAVDLLRSIIGRRKGASKTLVYLDPPYFRKGALLYLNAYRPRDHQRLARFLGTPLPYRWVVSYDNVPEIRDLYTGFQQTPFDMTHTAYERRVGHEVLICDPRLAVDDAALHCVCIA